MKILKKAKFIFLPLSSFIALSAISCSQVQDTKFNINEEIDNVDLVEKLPAGLAKSEILPSTLSRQNFDLILSSEFNSTVYIQPNDDEGKINVWLSISKDNQVSKTKIFTFNGYKTQMSNPTEEDLENLLDLLTIETYFDRSKYKASEIKGTNILIKNGENLLDQSYLANIRIDPNDIEGRVIVYVSLTKGVITSQTRSFGTLDGFKIVKQVEKPPTSTPAPGPGTSQPKDPIKTINLPPAKAEIRQLLGIPNAQKDEVAIKTLYDKYTEGKANSTSDYALIKASPLAAFAYALEATKTDGTDENSKNIIKTILEKTESATESKLEGILTTSLEKLRMFATAIAGKSAINGISVEQLTTMYKEIVDDVLTNYYYGSKTKADGSVENQKVYKNWNIYESHEGNGSMLAQISDLVFRGQDFLDSTTKEKYKKSLNYFVPNVSKLYASDISRYVVAAPYISKINDHVDRVSQYFAFKLLASQINNDQALFKQIMKQLKTWYETVEVKPKVKNNAWANVDDKDTGDVVSIKDLKLRLSVDKIRYLIRAVWKVTNNTYAKDLQTIFAGYVTWLTTDYLVNDINDENVESVSKESLQTLAILLRTTPSLGGEPATAIIDKIKEILDGKTTAGVTNFATIWPWAKTELQKYLSTEPSSGTGSGPTVNPNSPVVPPTNPPVTSPVVPPVTVVKPPISPPATPLEPATTEPLIVLNLASVKANIGQIIGIPRADKVDATIKALYDKYNAAKANETSDYTLIKASPLAAFVYATEATKDGGTDENAKNSVKTILEKNESATESKLEGILTTSLAKLRMFATTITAKSAVSGISTADLTTMYKEIVDDVLTNYYYGTKTKTDGSVESQKVYKNWTFYEDYSGAHSMLAQLSDLVFRGQDFLESTTKKKYQSALVYFIPDISKIWATDQSRYVMNRVNASKVNDRVDRVLQYFAYKSLASQINNDEELFKQNLAQLKSWFESVEIKPTIKGNPWANADTSEAGDTVTLKDLKLRLTIDKIRYISVTIQKATGKSYTKGLEQTFKTYFDWLKTDFLVNTINSTNVESASVEKLRILGILIRTIPAFTGDFGTSLLDKIKEVLNGKQKTNITNLSRIGWTWAKEELEKYLS